MKISFILSTLWLSGGVRVIIEYANGLTQRGHQVNLVVSGGTIQQDINQEIDRQVNVLETKVNLPANPLKSSPVKLFRLAWSLASTTPRSDFVISTQTPTTVAGFIATRIYRRGVPLWLYQDYLEMFSGRPVESWLLRNAMRWHKSALVVSAYSGTELNRFRPCDTIIVREGLSHSELFITSPSPSPGSIKDKRNILFLGDMRPRKGLYDFLDAVKITQQTIPNIHLWIVSKDDCQIKTHIPFDYFYRPERSDLARLYASCDLFVSASWWESFGIPPLEAMACGAPVVLTDSRGVREYARSGENCLMTPIKNPQALAQAMVEVLSNPALAEKLRQNGPVTAKEFSWKTSIDRFENALLQMHRGH